MKENQLENTQKISYEYEMYDNGYIKFFVIEFIKYKLVDKSNMPNYLENLKIITDEELKKYNIDIDSEKYVAIIQNIQYKIKFNDFLIRDEFEKIEYLYCDDNEYKFKAYITGNSPSIGTISFSQVTQQYEKSNEKYLVYSTLNIPCHDFEKIEKRCDILAREYLHRLNAVPNVYYERYQKIYRMFIKDELLKISINKFKLESSFEKIKKRGK